MSVVEATLDNPGPVLAAQLDRLKTETLAALKAAGVEYEERIEALDKLEYPKPLRDWTYDLFDAYRVAHPWAADYNIPPKSVARDLYERAMTFSRVRRPLRPDPLGGPRCCATCPTSTGASSATSPKT